MKTIQVSNLNNSIRFYSLLLGKSPVDIQPDRVLYRSDLVTLELLEMARPALTTHYLSIRPQDFIPTFRQVKSLQNRLGHQCRLLADTFTLRDPDGHRWLIASSELSNHRAADYEETCYLEPLMALA